MDVLSFRDYCLSLPLTEESTPFDETTLVYKIGGKMYACADMNDFGQVAVKCDPDEAVRLRERYEEIGPAYHFNKTHWNGIRTAGDLPDAFIREQIRNSYLLVVRQQRHAPEPARGDSASCRRARAAGMNLQPPKTIR